MIARRVALAAAFVLGACESAAPVSLRKAPPPAPSPPPAERAPPPFDLTPARVPEQAPSPQVRPVPAGLVDLRVELPAARFSIGYAGADNFTAAPLPGYGAPGAWAHPAVGKALRAVDRALAAEDLGLLIYDAYRPTRASVAMVAWARRSGRMDLLRDGYIAERSQHNRGLAVDLTLVERSSGRPLDMGGAWDRFEPSSAAFAATGAALGHRKRLRAVMLAHGFAPHDGEWWHFSLAHAQAPALDVPYGSAEPETPSR